MSLGRMSQRARRALGAVSLAIAISAGVPGSASGVLVYGDSVALTWSPADGPVVGYRVETDRDGAGFAFAANVREPRVGLRGQPGEVIRVRVAGYGANGEQGPWSQVSAAVQFAALPPSEGETTLVVGETGAESDPEQSRESAESTASESTREAAPSETTETRTRNTLLSLSFSNDFDGDGQVDASFWNPDARTVDVRLMRNGAVVGGFASDEARPGWTPSGSGDFDGDGDGDLLWHEAATGRAEIWLLDAGQTVSVHSLPAAVPTWTPQAAKDMTGDRIDDIVWSDPAAEVGILWEVAGGRTVRSVLWPVAYIGYEAIQVGDFDGDRLEDVLLRDPASGQQALWSTTADAVAHVTSPWDPAESTPMGGASGEAVPSTQEPRLSLEDLGTLDLFGGGALPALN